jgi:glucose/arabinose dehydrogenase
MSRRRWTGPLLIALSLGLMVPLSASASPSGTAGLSSSPADAATADTTATAGTTTDTAVVPLEDLTISATQVAFGLRRPTAIVAPDDGTDRLFITEKFGTVRVYHPDTGLAADPLLDVSEHVNPSGNERGLLGIALAPDFADSQTLYLAYTALPDGAVTLARYTLADAGLEVLLEQEHAEYGNHNGGQLAFGPDGHLYWSIGDGGGSGDPFQSGQRLDTLLGKILRLDVSGSCGELPYCIPEDNPFADVAGARGEIWHYGLRNPWRFSFDALDGSQWIGDVGQGRMEEIDHLAPGEGGANLGWSCYEGTAVFDEDACLPGEDYTAPVFTYPLTGGNCAVIGGHVYYGQEFADLAYGTYVAVDYCYFRAWGLRPDGTGGYDSAQIGELPTQVTAFGVTADGEFYVVNDLPGGLHRVSFEGPEPEPTCAVSQQARSWGTGMTSDITLTNTGDTPISDWSLTFALPAGHQIIGSWNGRFTQTGDEVTATSVPHNATLAPGDSTILGLVTSHSGDPAIPADFALNGDVCGTG